MAQHDSPSMPWMINTSTFIHAMIVDRVPLVASVALPSSFPNTFSASSWGTNAKESTRDQANAHVAHKRIGIQGLTLADLDKLALLSAPRKIGLGELACLSLRSVWRGGVLCDDWRAKAWLDQKMKAARSGFH